MRKIKFRVWDKKEKKMYLAKEAGKYIVISGGRWQGINKDFILMQYTGLKDKNGKEIYEGDLLRETHPNLPWAKKGQMLLECLWDEKYAGFYLISRRVIGDEMEVGTRWAVKAQNKHAEVIGNIYENPELLAEKK